MKKKSFIIFTMVIILSVVAVGCTSLDVVGQTAISSFSALDAKLSNSTTDPSTATWTLFTPDGQSLILSTQPGATTDDAVMRLSATPFMEAGLTPDKLPANYSYDQSSDTLMLSVDLGNSAYSNDAGDSMSNTFNALVNTYRKSIDYHEALDHYGLLFGEGNAFEWAKDLTTNDKDIVFVLNPEPLIAAGVDPSKVNGWVFTEVEVKDSNGAIQKVEKLLKPYSLED